VLDAADPVVLGRLAALAGPRRQVGRNDRKP